MPQRYYFPIFIVALAFAVFGVGAMFGLGVVKPTAPPAKTKADVNFTTDPKVVRRGDAEKATASAELSPIYPTKPDAARAEDKPAASAEDKSAAPANAPVAEPQAAQGTMMTGATANVAATDLTAGNSTAATDKPAQAVEAPPAKPAPAKVATTNDDKTIGKAPHEQSEAAPAKTAVERSNNRCDVSACASAYKSFRESDCTYQPFEGPRQVCASPPQSRSASAAVPSERRGDVIQRDRRPARADVEVMDDDDDGGPVDVAPPRRHRPPGFFPFSIFRW